MTIAEINDLFLAKYDLASKVRGAVKIPLETKLIANFISAAQQDIQRRLLVLEDTTDITLGTSSNEYSLPNNFGRHKNAVIGSDILTEKSGRYIREQIAVGNSGNWYGIYTDGNTQKLITPKSSGTLTLYYYPDTRYYQPSISADQDWGNFNGVIYSGKLLLPDRYDMAVLYYMLAEVVPDFEARYERELRSLRGSRVSSNEEALGYELGGVNDAVSVSLTTTSAVASPTADVADKSIRFRVSDSGGDATKESSAGWTTDPTLVNNVSTLVITSASGEFSNYLQVTINNENFAYSLSGSVLTITTSPSSGWGDVEIILRVWT